MKTLTFRVKQDFKTYRKGCASNLVQCIQKIDVGKNFVANFQAQGPSKTSIKSDSSTVKNMCFLRILITEICFQMNEASQAQLFTRVL